MEVAKYPKAGMKKANEPNEDKVLHSETKPTMIKAITIASEAYPAGVASHEDRKGVIIQ